MKNPVNSVSFAALPSADRDTKERSQGGVVNPGLDLSSTQTWWFFLLMFLSISSRATAQQTQSSYFRSYF
jgi:hypothetical protein